MSQTREEVVSQIDSRYIVLTPDGDEVVITRSNVESVMDSFPVLAPIVRDELLGAEGVSDLPSIRAMMDLEMVDYESASDRGHFRFYPKGALVFNLIKKWAEEIALVRLGAYQIETPIVYDWNEPDIRSQAESFHERHYRVQGPNEDGREFILRFAGDFGLFRMMKDAQLTYRHLPVRMFEFAPSFRYERSGELTGLKRLRAFWMPDVHSFCADLDQGIDEYLELYMGYTDLANGTGVDYVVAFRIVEEFYHQHRQEILEMIAYSGQPVFIELLSEMKHYWVMKHEINTVDTCGGVCQVSTVQLDVKDASLYGITYVTPKGDSKGCTIVHSSVGSPERWIFSILENSLKMDVPTLPLWLSPTQVRIIPVSTTKHLPFCGSLAEELRQHGIRVDIDDRSNPMGWKIRASEREWVPYVLVVGDQEMESPQLSVRVRGRGQTQLSASGLVETIKSEIEGMPFERLPGDLISKRPVFRGRI